jgi:hypothetical protein
MGGDSWHPTFRAALIAAGFDPADTFTLVDVAALTGISPRAIARQARMARLRTIKVANRRVTRGAWLRAWLEVWHPEVAVQQG